MDALLGLAHPQQAMRAGSEKRGPPDFGDRKEARDSKRGATGASQSLPASLSLVGITRRFGGQAPAVDDLSLDVASGELLALVGASGSGKTTTLRMVAGYERPDAGKILLEGRDITALPPERRRFGMVFQHYALFPHLTVGDNVAFGLEARGVGRRERNERTARALENVGLGGSANRQVQSLSGGEQQRVAVARALIIEPPVLLLDEPLSNLDPTLRTAMREELRSTLRGRGVTVLFVTHDQEDAFAVADRVALLRHGRLLQMGTPEDLYDRPASREVADFIGRSVLVPALYDGSSVTITLGGVARRVRATAAPAVNGSREVSAVIRPDALALVPDGSPESWPGVVASRRFAGALLAYRVRVEPELELEVYSTERSVREGDRVAIAVVREPVAVV
jgi:putative spermidine/putrescine transport system ATP-binding protein